MGRFWKAPVLEGGCCEGSGEGLAAFDAGLAPHVFLHGLFCGHPWAASFAPAGRACDGFLQPELVSDRSGVFECVFPIGRHVGEALLDYLGSEEGGIEVLETAQAGAVHPLQIELDALLGDVAVHPVPPYAGAGTLGRRFEAALQGIGCVLCRGQGGSESKAQRGASRGSMAQQNRLQALGHGCTPFGVTMGSE